MRVLITLSEPFLPQQGGGAQTSSLELLSAFKRHGADVAIASILKRKSLLGIKSVAQMNVWQRKFVKSTYLSHPIYRMPDIHRHIDHVLDDFRPDVVLVQAMNAMPLAHRINDMHVPMVIYWRDAEVHRMNGTPCGLTAKYIANSQFIASFYKKNFDVDSTIIPPLIERERYLAPQRTKRFVVFVGTVPEKGLALAMKIARLCPDIPFKFVESWILPLKRKNIVKAALRSLPNVNFVPYQTSMLGVYGYARLLLAPSQWEEGWGRVASEAHINGIPVVGSRIGGLTEAIGRGGVLIDPKAPATDWAEVIKSLWYDGTAYQRLSREAEEYSHREDLNPDWAINRIVNVLKQAISHS